MFRNFIISGYGRSGTVFLTSLCNLSNQWKVFHEYHVNNKFSDSLLGNEPVENDCLNYSKTFLDKIEHRLSQDFIGNINGYLRYSLKHFNNVKYIGAIFRDPRDIMLSIANKYSDKNKWLFYAAELLYYCKWFQTNIRSNPTYHIIDFRNMTTDRSYTNLVLNDMGVIDVNITDEVFKKINSSGKLVCPTYKDLPKEVRWIIDSIS